MRCCAQKQGDKFMLASAERAGSMRRQELASQQAHGLEMDTARPQAVPVVVKLPSE